MRPTRTPIVLAAALSALLLSGCVLLPIPIAQEAAVSAQSAPWAHRVVIVAASAIAPASPANPATQIYAPGMKLPAGSPVMFEVPAIRSVELWNDRSVYRGTLLVILLDDPATQSFAEWTSLHGGEQLLVAIDGTIVSAPTIVQRIDTGHFGVPVGYERGVPWVEPRPSGLP